MNEFRLIGECIGILPSGQGFYTGTKKESYLYTVPYSLHSSFPELREFVSKVSAEKVIPLVPSEDFLGHLGIKEDPKIERSERVKRAQKVIEMVGNNVSPVRVDVTKVSSSANNSR